MKRKGFIEDKRGQDGSGWIPIIGILLAIILIFGIIWLVSTKVGDFSSSSISQAVGTFKTFGEVSGNTAMAPFTYVIGGVPVFLINEIGPTASMVVMFVLFIMLLFSFGDIISTFGMFTRPVSLLMGIGLTIIAANLRFIMFVAVICFGIVAGVGVISIAMGLLVPFVIFFALNWLLLSQIKHMRNLKNLKKGGEDLAATVKAFGKIGEGIKVVGERDR